MAVLLKLLAGKAGPYIAGGAATLVAVLLLIVVLQARHIEAARDDLEAANERARANYAASKSWEALIPGWRAAVANVQAAREREAKAARLAIEAATATKSQASSDAFDQGYAAGRAAGRKTCGATPHATTADPGSVLGPAGGGVRDETAGGDFADLFGRGAYLGAR